MPSPEIRGRLWLVCCQINIWIYSPTARCVWSTHGAYHCICYQGALEWLWFEPVIQNATGWSC